MPDGTTIVSGICVADESQWKTTPGARHATPTVAQQSNGQFSRASGLNRRDSDDARASDSWAVHATKSSESPESPLAIRKQRGHDRQEPSNERSRLSLRLDFLVSYSR